MVIKITCGARKKAEVPVNVPVRQYIYFMLEYRSNALCIWSFLNCEYDLLLQNVTIWMLVTISKKWKMLTGIMQEIIVRNLVQNYLNQYCPFNMQDCIVRYNVSTAPFPDGHFFPRFHPQIRFLYHLEALLTENSKMSSTKSSMECQEIITKHFFFCPSSWREFRHFICLLIFCCRVSRRTKKNLQFFWHFWKLNGYLLSLDIWSLIWHSFDDDAHHFIEFSILCQ